MYLQRINMYKQLGCVTSIYATSALDSNGTKAAACDPYGDVELPLRSLVRNAPRIDSSYPGMIEVMAECLRINPLKRPRMSQVSSKQSLQLSFSVHCHHMGDFTSRITSSPMCFHGTRCTA